MDTDATTYYVDPEHGRPHADGRSPLTASRTVQPEWRRPGVTILFKRGTTTRGSLPIFTGTPGAWVRLGAYGEGPRPVFTLSDDLCDPRLWTPHRPGVWRYVWPVEETANIVYNDGPFCGAKRWVERDLNAIGDWWESNQTLLIRCDQNPGRHFRSIELVPARTHAHFRAEHSHIVVEDIHIRNAGVHGFWITGGHHIVIRRCEVSYIGGAVYPSHGIGVPQGLTVRYGNAFEVWSGGHHILLEDSVIYETYDGAVCLQGLSNDLIHHVAVRNCLFFDNSFDTFDWSWGVKLRQVYFEHNTCVNAGVGWGVRTEGRPRLSAFLPDSVGWHFFITNVDDPAEISVRHNIFYDCPRNPLLKFRCEPRLMDRITLDRNCYFQPEPRDPLAWFNGRLYGVDEFEKYTRDSGKDANSFVADPCFVDEENRDFRLREDSPCRGAVEDDAPAPRFEGMPEPGAGGPDIGANLEASRTLVG